MGQFLGNMFSQITVAGLDSPVNARFENTDSAVAQAYVTYLLPLVNYYKGTKSDAFNWSSVDAAAAATALQNLLKLAKDGIAGPNGTSYLTTEMAQNLDFLVRSFKNAGVEITNGTVTFPGDGIAALQQWKDSTVLSPLVGDLFSNVINAMNVYGAAITTAEGANAATLNRSIQAAIEIEYVQTANDVLNKKMAALEGVLGTLNTINNQLAVLQDLHNKLTVDSKTPNNALLSGTMSAKALKSYYNYASSQYGNPILPTLAKDLIGGMTGGGIAGNNANYASFSKGVTPKPANWSYKVAVTTYILGVGGAIVTPITYYKVPISIFPTLSSTGTDAFIKLLQTKQSIEAQINALSGVITPTEKSDASSIYNQLKTVIQDLNNSLYAQPAGAATPVPFTINNYQTSSMGGSIEMLKGFRRWLIDNYDAQGAETSKSGLIQQNISKAITAAESTNDSKKEDVRNFLFLFEEFYKSASTVLQAISQIIQKMGQGIKGG